jgi:hypothetical protein
MVHGMTRWLGVVVAVVAASAQAALAQDAAEIVRHAVAAMHRAVHTTQSDVGEAATRGVAAINRLDDGGASDRELISAAEHADRVINGEAHQGLRQVRMIAARAAEALRQIGADRRFFAALHDARDRSIEAINQAGERAHGAVATALREALND